MIKNSRDEASVHRIQVSATFLRVGTAIFLSVDTDSMDGYSTVDDFALNSFLGKNEGVVDIVGFGFGAFAHGSYLFLTQLWY
jgi:hypothetical protein